MTVRIFTSCFEITLEILGLGRKVEQPGVVTQCQAVVLDWVGSQPGHILVEFQVWKLGT